MLLKVITIDSSNKSEVMVPIIGEKGHFIINTEISDCLRKKRSTDFVIMVEVIERGFCGKEAVVSNYSVNTSTFQPLHLI